MDETATRRKKIDPKLYNEGWEQVPDSEILTEQRAYISPGRIGKLKSSKPKKADYVLKYRGRKLAVIEAKSDERDVSEGVEQAKLYAGLLNIRFAYATNGDDIWEIDMGVRDAQGKMTVPSTEGPVSKFPTPQELWRRTFPKDNVQRDTFNACAMNRDGGRSPRYYQEIAINAVLDAVAEERKRILLTMATGTGKTYTAFQICWKLTKTQWNKDHAKGRTPRILFIADRNILSNQARNDFGGFDEDSMVRITPAQLAKDKRKVPTSRHLYFTIFQTIMCDDGSGEPYYKQYPRDFFDFIIIDECHRGGANDESEWRAIMEYFGDAYQLGMTATPLRKVNANTYRYFGNPVYSYSLKQGIADGFLTPFRVWISQSNIDEYVFDPDDDVVQGEVDANKVYTEQDFYNGNIVIRERDEHRVQELLSMIKPDDKTIIFCNTQLHAAVVRDMVNRYKQVADSNYCVRITADDGEDGERMLRTFQDNERLRPTVLTTSRKLSTGVDARNVRNIVLMRRINDIVEFKQIIGRGTRLFEGKYHFTIYDFVKASDKFQDAEWDGDPICPKCGNWPCSCGKQPPQPCPTCGNSPCTCGKQPPQPCPTCGNLPCTCDGNGGLRRKAVVVRLSEKRKLALSTEWTEKVQFGDELISVDELLRRLFRKLPEVAKSADELRRRWADPESRMELLGRLADEGFDEQKIEMAQKVVRQGSCDMLDVLEFVAYNIRPLERSQRVSMAKKAMDKRVGKEGRSFVYFVLDYYERNGYKELAMDRLKNFITIKYGSMADAKSRLGMEAADIRECYKDIQTALYSDISTESGDTQDSPYLLSAMIDKYGGQNNITGN